jgi:hypothetical protein
MPDNKTEQRKRVIQSRRAGTATFLQSRQMYRSKNKQPDWDGRGECVVVCKELCSSGGEKLWMTAHRKMFRAPAWLVLGHNSFQKIKVRDASGLLRKA